MWSGLLADLVVVIHVAYVGYIIAGLALIVAGLSRAWGWVLNPWFRLTHLAAILIVILGPVLKTTCPLTVLELRFHSMGGSP